MPLRSVKMKRFILGFHRRVWCPKWTPLSRSWRMVTTAMARPSGVGSTAHASSGPRRLGGTAPAFRFVAVAR